MASIAVKSGPTSDWGSGLRILARVVSIAVLSIIVPLALVLTIPDSGRSQAWVVCIVITIWGGVRLSLLWVSGIPRLFDFFFWLYTYVFMGMAAAVQIRTDDIPDTTPGMNPALDMVTVYLVLGGIACYEVSRVVWLWTQRHREGSAVRPAVVNGVRAVLLYVGGLAASAYYLSKVGIRIAITDRETAGDLTVAAWPDMTTRGLVAGAAVYPLLVATGAIVQVRRGSPKGGFGRFGWGVLIAVGITASMLVASPISSARYTFGTVAFAIAVYLGATRTQVRARLAMLGMIAAMIFLFPLANAFRNSSLTYGGRSSFFGEYAGSPDYDSIWQISNAWSYWLSGMAEPMRQLSGSLLFWVPRGIWSDKPNDTGILLANYRGYSFTNLSAPVWAELLVNGGLLALVIGFLLLGPTLASLDRRMAPGHFAGDWWSLAGAILPVYTMILMRGSLLQATGSLFVMLVCLLWVRKRPPLSTPPQAVPR